MKDWQLELSRAILLYVAWQLFRGRMSAYSLLDKLHFRGWNHIHGMVDWERKRMISCNGTDCFVLDGSVGNWTR
jgi:hypothetical protein